MILRVPRQLFALPLLVACACGGGRQADRVAPSIEFTAVPPAAAGGSDRTIPIAAG